MIKTANKLVWKRTLATIFIALLLLSVMTTMFVYIYTDAEREGFDKLKGHAQRLNEEITLQMVSDQENLITMARMAARLYSEQENFDVLLSSFESIGLIKDVGILLQDNILMTKHGAVDTTGTLSFEEEVLRGAYISGRMPDATNASRELVRSAVPIEVDGETVAILYGAIRLDYLEKKYTPLTQSQETDLYILERGSGNFIVDTLHDTLSSIDEIGVREAKQGYEYQHMVQDLKDGRTGFTVFRSGDTGEYLYAYYMPLEIGGWQLMLTQTEHSVFRTARFTGVVLAVTISAVLLLIAFYVILLLRSIRRQATITAATSKARKLLLEVNYRGNGIAPALESLSCAAAARSSFYVGVDHEEYCFILPHMEQKLLLGEDRQYFILQLMEIMRRYGKNTDTSIHFLHIRTNSKLKAAAPEFCAFLNQHGIYSVCFTAIANKEGIDSMLGLINPRHLIMVRDLLTEVIVCFAMALFNQKHLAKTEKMAVTDSLTGLSNRLAYMQDIAVFDKRMPRDFSCVYVDVNELHIINNLYGHAAGDEMLLYIARKMREAFAGGSIYRMGGDEFLVFSENLPIDEVKRSVSELKEQVEARDFHISVGVAPRVGNMDTSAAVKEAEKRMYEEKAAYYQKKEISASAPHDAVPVEHSFRGIFCISLETDAVHPIFTTNDFRHYLEAEPLFSKALCNYMNDCVLPEYHRAIFNALNYSALEKQLRAGVAPSVSYVRRSGERLLITVHALPGQDVIRETLWTFARVSSFKN